MAALDSGPEANEKVVPRLSVLSTKNLHLSEKYICIFCHKIVASML